MSPHAAIRRRELYMRRLGWLYVNPDKEMPREIAMIGLELFQSLRDADTEDLALFFGPGMTFLERDVTEFITWDDVTLVCEL